MLPASALGFVLFLLVNVTLFLRPADMWPSWEGLPVYEGLILGAFVLSLQRMQRLFWPTEIRSQPITICVLGLLVAVVMSHLMHMFLWGVNHMGTEFTKTLIYYTTLVAVVSTAERLKILLLTVAVAARVPGTTAHDIASGVTASGEDDMVVLEHPTGRFETAVTVEIRDGQVTVERAGLVRTARKLMDGTVFARGY